MVARRLWIVAAPVAAAFGARPADGRGAEPPRAHRPSRLYTIEPLMDTRRDRAMLQEISPALHADRIRRPLLVLQGTNDPRAIKPESDDIVAALKKDGVPVEYAVFPDEGHGFTKKQNRIAGDRAILEFLGTYLEPASRYAGRLRRLRARPGSVGSDHIG